MSGAQGRGRCELPSRLGDSVHPGVVRDQTLCIQTLSPASLSAFPSTCGESRHRSGPGPASSPSSAGARPPAPPL